jgi:prophage regulatory protein
MELKVDQEVDLAVLDRLPAVIARVGMKRSWIYREIAEGRFPAPRRIGPRTVGWLRSDVVAWVEARAR